MKDGPIRRAVKRIALWQFRLDLAIHRARLHRRKIPVHGLGGACQLCAACCEAPGIQVGWTVWYVPILRRLFLAWQRHVNGFELTGRDVRTRVFVFRCTHFDWETRRCDSYDSRPGLCRDYPRVLLEQAHPEMLPGCGYRPIAPNAPGLRRALERTALTPEQRERLWKGLHLEG